MVEFYLFNTNGTFTKSEKEIRLNFHFGNLHDNNLNLTEYLLNYPNDSEIIGSCYEIVKKDFRCQYFLVQYMDYCDGPC
jgi:hypothetical protein